MVYGKLQPVYLACKNILWRTGIGGIFATQESPSSFGFSFLEFVEQKIEMKQEAGFPEVT